MVDAFRYVVHMAIVFVFVDCGPIPDTVTLPHLKV